jgi:thiol-disulfide isomerase/thioredoxin
MRVRVPLRWCAEMLVCGHETDHMLEPEPESLRVLGMAAHRLMSGWRALVYALASALILLALAELSKAQVRWHSDYEVAARMAQKVGQPLLVEFYTNWCQPCKWMEKSTFRDRRVAMLMARCVCVRVDIDQSENIARKFGVKSIPHLLIIGAKGERLLDSLGYRDAVQLREELALALRGKPVVQNDNSKTLRATAKQPVVTILRTKLEKGEYAAWRAQKPADAAQACARLVEALASFDEATRKQARELLGRLGNDGIDALIGGLGHPLLAVRVAAYDQLTHLLETQHRLPVAAQPRYDAWASRRERARWAKVWAQWWAHRQRNTTTTPL